MSRIRPDWASDTSLYYRIRDAVRILARGRLDYHRRMNLAIGGVLQIGTAGFPEDLQPATITISRIAQNAIVKTDCQPLTRYSHLTPSERDELNNALLQLYEAVVGDRARLSARSDVED
jgi:hypothetical protein